MMLIWSRWYGIEKVRKIARETGVSTRYLCDSRGMRGAYGGNIAGKLRDVGVPNITVVSSQSNYSECHVYV